MKRIVFLTRSRLAQNLMELILPSVPRKAQVSGFSGLAELDKAFFPKPVQLIVLDESFLEGCDPEGLGTSLNRSAFKASRRIAFLGKSPRLSREALGELGFSTVQTKPFLPEELADILNRNLGSRK